ncbi:hypothetical protein [Bradyrhizobium ottawaense]|uniref:hypothetical protein n=1 Tax=Bradyrhizobium ottawaense TaxID=931866 RepID=UPI0038338D46
MIRDAARRQAAAIRPRASVASKVPMPLPQAGAKLSAQFAVELQGCDVLPDRLRAAHRMFNGII